MSSNVAPVINRLEQELACQLFIRSNKGITLTHEGEILFAHVQEAVQHIVCAETETSLPDGSVELSAPEKDVPGSKLNDGREGLLSFPVQAANSTASDSTSTTAMIFLRIGNAPFPEPIG